ncbi:MAG TPA: hypothetical protein VHD63_02535 [Ktedonobacteraceae bacterium]|nr:hypothetical protein [Ktedonobacteraceae bacterium]
MPDEKTQQGVAPEPINLLQNKPQRRSRRGPAVLLLLLGGAIIVAVVAIVAWQTLVPHTSSPGSSATAKSHQSGNPVPPGWNDPAIYWQIIRTQVARGLHLSVTQITAQLQAAGATSTATPALTSKNDAAPSPGAAMTNLAAQQGLSTDQLRALELNALQTACNTLVAQGKLTQTDASQRIQEFSGWDQGTLNWYVMHAFTGQ